jgi:putative transposase
MKYNPQIHHRRSIRLKGYDYSQVGLYFITICCQHRKHHFGKIENHEMVLNEYGTIAYDEWAKLPERFTNFELDVFQIMPNHMHGIILLTEFVGAGFTPAQNAAQNAQNTQTGCTPAQNNIDTPVENDSNNTIENGQTQPGQPESQTQPGQPESQTQPGQPESQTQPGQPESQTGQPQGIAPTVGDIVGAYKSLVANGCLEIYKSKNEMMGKLWQRNYYEHIIRNVQSYNTISEYIINNPQKWRDDKFFTE